MTGWNADIQRDGFKRAMARLGLKTAADIARQAGIPQTTMRSYLNGQADSLSARNEKKICEATGLTLAQLYDEHDAETRRLVWVVGFIGAGGVVSYMQGEGRPDGLRDEQQPFEFDTIKGLYEVRSPPGLPENRTYVAYELRGFPMRPAKDRWILYFLKQDDGDLAELIGEPCIIQTADGRTVFRVLRPGYKVGRFNLESWDGSDLETDAEVIEAYLYVGQARPEMAKPD